jgi:hypothetical protein
VNDYVPSQGCQTQNKNNLAFSFVCHLIFKLFCYVTFSCEPVADIETDRRIRVVSTPASYSRGPGFESALGDHLLSSINV